MVLAKVSSYAILYCALAHILNRPAFPKGNQLTSHLRSLFHLDYAASWEATVIRWATAFSLGSLTGASFGIILGRSRPLYRFLRLDLNFFRSLPATVLVTFLLAVFGFNELTGAFPAFYITLFTVAYITATQVNEIDETRIEHLYDLGAGWRFVARHCLAYEILPHLLTAVGQALSLAFLVQVSSEMIIGSVGNRGLGNAIIDWKDHMDYAEVVLTTILLGTAGLLANLIVDRARARLIFWNR